MPRYLTSPIALGTPYCSSIQSSDTFLITLDKLQRAVTRCQPILRRHLPTKMSLPKHPLVPAKANSALTSIMGFGTSPLGHAYGVRVPLQPNCHPHACCACRRRLPISMTAAATIFVHQKPLIKRGPSVLCVCNRRHPMRTLVWRPSRRPSSWGSTSLTQHPSMAPDLQRRSPLPLAASCTSTLHGA